MSEQNQEILSAIESARGERIAVIDAISISFWSKTLEIVKLNELLKLRHEITRVIMNLGGLMTRLRSFHGNKFAERAMQIFERESYLFSMIKQYLFDKTAGMKKVDPNWVATNLHVDMLISFASELVQHKVEESLLVSQLEREISGLKAA